MKGTTIALAVLLAAPALALAEPQGVGDQGSADDVQEVPVVDSRPALGGERPRREKDAGEKAGQDRPARQPRFLGPPLTADPPRAQGYRRGRVLPPTARGQVMADYARHRLRQPPPGYVYYQVGSTAYLTNRETGLIFEAVPIR